MKRSTFLKGLVGVPIVVAGGILLKEEETIVDSPIEEPIHIELPKGGFLINAEDLDHRYTVEEVIAIWREQGVLMYQSETGGRIISSLS